MAHASTTVHKGTRTAKACHTAEVPTTPLAERAGGVHEVVERVEMCQHAHPDRGSERYRQQHSGQKQYRQVQAVHESGEAVQVLRGKCHRNRESRHGHHEEAQQDAQYGQARPVDPEPESRACRHHYCVEHEHHDHAREDGTHEDGEPAGGRHPEALDDARLELEESAEPGAHAACESEQGQDPWQEMSSTLVVRMP